MARLAAGGGAWSCLELPSSRASGVLELRGVSDGRGQLAQRRVGRPRSWTRHQNGRFCRRGRKRRTLRTVEDARPDGAGESLSLSSLLKKRTVHYKNTGQIFTDYKIQVSFAERTLGFGCRRGVLSHRACALALSCKYITKYRHCALARPSAWMHCGEKLASCSCASS